MNIRPATAFDIPAIVQLLRESLGESLMPKSEAYWNWKHIDNPFGSSPVIVAEHEGRMVGVRAFMRWQWQLNGRSLRAVRAVDTATHPSFQGKGIFKKLTLALVDSCKRDGEDFIFNTPNSQSKPGYLKMGWEVAGRLPIRVSVKNPLKVFRNIITPAHHDGGLPHQGLGLLAHPGLDGLLAECQNDVRHKVTTIASAQYMRWRYEAVPVVNYSAIGDIVNGSLLGILLLRTKVSRFGRELRVTDIFISPGRNGMALFEQLRELERKWDIDYTSVSGLARPEVVAMMKKYAVYCRLDRGPSVTIRNLNLDEMNVLKQFSHWSPSFGDLELF